MAPASEPSAITPLLPADQRTTNLAIVPPSPISSSRSSFASTTPSERLRLHRAPSRALQFQRALSFATALLAALCAGSITVFSLYGPAFQERLHYTQPQVNSIAIAGSIALYLPVPLMGYLCDRIGPAPLSGLAAVLFGAGYGLAAWVYRKVQGDMARFDNSFYTPELSRTAEHAFKAIGLMRLAFVLVGAATCAMYLAAVATCAKTFGRGRHRGLALALPIAAFGLSGMWESQVGSRLLGERDDKGNLTGEVDVAKFFIFLAILLSAVGIVGVFTLRIVEVDEEELIEEAVDQLERSGVLLNGSALFTPGRVATPGRPATPGRLANGANGANGGNGIPPINGVGAGSYGAIERSDPFEDLDDDATAAALLEPDKDNEQAAPDEAKAKKQWVLNAETRRFLTDHTMWFFALGFFFMIGPGEAFINNMGTVIKTLYRPTQMLTPTTKPTSAATHVSIVAITSTVARLLTGTLTDLLAPSPAARTLQLGGADSDSIIKPSRISLSRVTFLLTFALILSAGLVSLASGAIQDHADKFWIVSSLVGAGYGAVFSLTPIIITVIWGVENFATNWGIVAMFPALGATLWGSVYSKVYERGAERTQGEDTMCYGMQCYAATFWAMAGSVWLACLLILWAWKGRGGWSARGIVV
jgi:MFS family permease